MAMNKIMEGWRKYINEIGDASAESYPFKVIHRPSSGIVRYGFNSEEFLYHVEFDLFPAASGNSTWSIRFEATAAAPQAGAGGAYSKETTGEGRPLRIMSTVVNIIKDFVGNPELNKGVLHFRFTGISKSGVADLYSGEVTQRTRLYKIFLEKNMPPGTKVEEVGTNVIAFTVPEEQKDETPV
tara:strand:+ start:313 stop:861 length:549 start_codon:yes stop_codon:yes gene_type:complete